MKRAIPRKGSAAEAGAPKSFWSLQIGKNRQSLQKRLGRPVPCEQGAADLWATASSAGLRNLVCMCDCVCVFGFMRLWDCGVVSLWVVIVLLVCVCVCVFTC